MKRFTALVAALLIAIVTYAQPIVTSVGNLTVCTDTLTVPVEVVKVANVGAISLVLEYDNSVLNFVEEQNPNPALSVGYSTVVNQAGNKIYMSWHSVAPLNILQGTLIEYVFTSTGGYSDLTWDVTSQGACEYSDVNANVLAANFVNGSVTVVPDPAITSNPADLEIEEGQSASFTVSATDADTYQWQVSTDGGVTWNDVVNGLPYTGATTTTLQIVATPVTYNQNQYRCVASGFCTPAAISAAATLTVNPIITTSIGNHSFCADEIIVPVNVEHFYGVAGISMTLGYNTVVLNYVGLHSTNPLMSGGQFFDNSYLGKVLISWFSITPVDLGDDLLLELAFTSSTPGSSALVWDLTLADNCEYNNLDSDIITSIWQDGNVTVLPTPFVYNVTGGGEYCDGDQGVMIGLSNSQIGVNYELFLDDTNLVMTVPGTGTALSFGYHTAVGNYTVHAYTVSNGCDMDMNGSVNVAVNPVPTADAGADQIMLSGTSATLTGSATGGTPGYTYEWMPGGMNTASVTVSPANTTTYTLIVTDSKGCQGQDDAEVVVYMNTINGQVTYNNNQNTPIEGATVYLQESGTKVLMTDVTDMNGNYEFAELPNGTYTVWATHNGTWGGVNSTDALVIVEHFIMLHPLTDPLKIGASDVDASGFVNSTDAFQAASRFVQNITSFVAGDWIFEDKEQTLFQNDYVTVDLKGMCYGDANGSYVPNMKATNQVMLNEQGVLNTRGEENILIPVTVNEEMIAGAVSLTLTIPADLEVTAVRAGNESAVFNQDGNQLMISWYSTDGMQLAKGEELLTIIAQADGIVNGSVDLIQGEIADADARTISQASISVPKLSSIEASDVLSNYPNPFRDQTTINYTASRDGQLVISVYNLLGEKVAEPVNTYHAAGTYNVQFDASELLPGIYHYKMELDGETMTRTMVRIK